MMDETRSRLIASTLVDSAWSITAGLCKKTYVAPRTSCDDPEAIVFNFLNPAIPAGLSCPWPADGRVQQGGRYKGKKLRSLSVHIDLRTKREADLIAGRTDYSLWAGKQRVGRIYQSSSIAPGDWHWAISTLTLDITFRARTQGYAETFEDAQARARVAFDRWLAWARALPTTDTLYPQVSAELKMISSL
jgi:hypothetical protein